MNKLSILMLAVAFCLFTQEGKAQDKTPPKDDKSLLQGRWYAVGEEVGGNALSKDELATLNKNLDVTGDAFRIERTANGKRLAYEGTMTLRQDQGQKLFDWQGKAPSGQQIELHGIYDLSENKFKLCYTAVPAGAKFTRPDEFRTFPGSGRIFVTFKRSAEKVEVAQNPKEKPGKKEEKPTAKKVESKEATAQPRTTARSKILDEKTWAWDGSQDNYANLDKMAFEVGMGNEKNGVGIAEVGLEIENVRWLSVNVDASPFFKRHDDNSFAGFMVDYHTAEGYTRRVAVPMGFYSLRKWGKNPGWGTNATPDQFVDVEKKNEYDLDLKKWAPGGWDGKVWFTVSLQNSGKNTTLKGKISLPSEEDTLLATKVIGSFNMSCTELPDLESHWHLTDDRRAIQDGNEMGTWKIAEGKAVITYSNKHFGLAVLSFKDQDTLVGKNEHKNGDVFHWLLKREKGSLTDVMTLSGHNKAINCLAFSPDSKFLVSGDDEGWVREWEIGSGKKRHWLNAKGSRINSVSYSQKDALVAIGIGGDRGQSTVQVVNAETWKRVAIKGWVNGLAEEFRTFVAFSPDGRTLAIGINQVPGTDFIWEGNIRILDAAEWKETAAHGRWGSVESLTFSPDGKWITAASRRSVVLLDHKAGKNLGNGIGEANSVAFSPDGRLLACASGKLLILWDLETQKSKEIIKLGEQESHSVAFSPDGKLMAIGTATKKEIRKEGNLHSLSYSGVISIWDVASLKKVESIAHNLLETQSFEVPRRHLAFSPDGAYLATVWNNNEIKVFRIGEPKGKGASDPKKATETNQKAAKPDTFQKEPPHTTPKKEPFTQTPPKDDKTLLQGRWYAIEEEAEGKALSTDELAKLNKILDVTGDDFRLERQVGDERRLVSGQISLQQTEAPKRFDFSGNVSKANYNMYGIYELSQDTLKLSYTSDKPSTRPLEFRTTPESGSRYVVFKRSAEKAEVAQKPKEEPGKKANQDDPTEKPKFTPLDISDTATVSSTRIFNQEAIIFPQWGKQTHHGVPFMVIDPDGGKIKNAICLYSALGAVSAKMPRNVSLGCGSPAREIHVLGAAGWGVPWFQAKNTLSMVMGVEYADGVKEDHEIINGVHLTDWAKGPDVSESKNIGVLQVRYFSVVPKRQDAVIRAIEFRKGTDKTSPVVLALTLELPVVQVVQKPKEEPSKPGRTKDDKTLLQGRWFAIEEETEGKALSKDGIATLNKILDVTGDDFQIERGAIGKRVVVEGKMTLGQTDSPKAFHFEGKAPSGQEIKLHGVYELSAEKFKLCYSVAAAGAKDTRPTEFRTFPGSGRIYVTFKRSAEKVEVVQKPKEEPGKNDTPKDITADFMPHKPGSIRLYDHENTFFGKTVIVRMKVEDVQGNQIRASVLKSGTKTGDTIAWNDNPPRQPPVLEDYRQSDGFIEIGIVYDLNVNQQKTWHPRLKLGAVPGTTWEWENPVTKEKQRYTVKSLQTVGNRQEAVIEENITSQKGGPWRNVYTYAYGVGLVLKQAFWTDQGIEKRGVTTRLVSKAAAETEPGKKEENPTEVAQKPKEEPGNVTADYFPFSKGSQRFVDYEFPVGGGISAMMRKKVTYQEKGGIEFAEFRVGAKQDGKVTWFPEQPAKGPQEQKFFREKDGFVYIGATFGRGLFWEPILKLGARDGDTWEWKDAGAPPSKYLLKTGLRHKGRPAIQVTKIAQGSLGGGIPNLIPLDVVQTTTIIYVKGVGEVESRTKSVPKDGGKELPGWGTRASAQSGQFG